MHLKQRMRSFARKVVHYPYKDCFHALKWKIGHLPFIKLFCYFIIEILGGYRLYKRLKKKYGKETVLLFCPHTGTGDIYNIGLFFHAFLKKENILKYSFLFRGKSEQKIGALFDIQGDTILSNREMIKLTRFAQFAEISESELMQIHHYHAPSTINERFDNFEEGYPGLSFNCMFKKVVMGLSDDVKPTLPQFEHTPQVIIDFSKKGLVKGKTVILAPYSSSAQIISLDTWEIMASQLKEAGYTVATNCISNKERPITGTVELGFEYKYAKDYVEYAGAFIGARSGLCDIVSSTNCKKIILTPFWHPNLLWLGSAGKTMRFYGMWPNYGRKDTTEIEYEWEHDTIARIPNKIIEILTDQKSQPCEVKIHQNLSPKFETKIAIALSFNEYFAPYAGVTLQSIIEFSSPENTYDIFALHDGLDERTKNMLRAPFEGLENFSIRFIDSRATISSGGFHVERGYTPITYNRVALPHILHQFERIIYLDADLIMNTDVAELYDYKLGPNLVAGVRDIPMIAWASDLKNVEFENMIEYLKLSEPYNYINAGVTIFNVTRFNEELPLWKVVEYISSRKLRWQDQDAINKLCEGKILVLPQEYNVITSLRNDAQIIRESNCPELIFEWRQAMESPKVLHFIGKSFLHVHNPPYYIQNYWKLARKTPYYELLQLRAADWVRGAGGY